jgi:hypothetical protein
MFEKDFDIISLDAGFVICYFRTEGSLRPLARFTKKSVGVRL